MITYYQQVKRVDSVPTLSINSLHSNHSDRIGISFAERCFCPPVAALLSEFQCLLTLSHSTTQKFHKQKQSSSFPLWGKSRRGWGLGLGGRSHYYFGRAVHHEIPHCEILHFVPVFLFGMTTLLFLLPVENIYENNVISTRRGVGSFAPKELQVTNRIKPENESTLHYTTLPLRGSWRGLFTQKSYKQKKSASFPLWSLSWSK